MDDDLKKLERKAYIAFYQDGLLDIFFGLMLSASGISALLEYYNISRHWVTISIVILPFMYISGKKIVTIPRLGRVNFSFWRKQRKSRVIVILVGVVMVSFALLVLAQTRLLKYDENFVRGYTGPLLEGLFFLIVFSIMAYLLDYNRLYIIALAFFISMPLAQALKGLLSTPFNEVVAYCVPGGGVVLFGVFLLLRFLRRYPKPDLEVLHES